MLEGPYDRSLSWPFAGTVKLELLNQLSDKNHYGIDLVLEKEDGLQVGCSRGFPMFIKHTELLSGNKQFLMNDSLYFQVSASVDNYIQALAYLHTMKYILHFIFCLTKHINNLKLHLNQLNFYCCVLQMFNS